MFSEEALKNFIQERLNTQITIPNGHSKAIFGFVNSTGDVSTGVAYRSSSGWQVQGDLEYHPHTDGLSAGLNLFKTWG